MLFRLKLLFCFSACCWLPAYALQGAAYFGSDAEGQIVIYWDGADKNGPDGYVDQIFVLQQFQEHIQELASQFSFDATLILEDQGLLLQAHDLNLALDWSISKPPAESGVMGLEMQQFYGFGIINYTYALPLLEMSEVTSELVVEMCNLSMVCNAGGPGSLSCAVGQCIQAPHSCSTSCLAPTYYSCCGCTIGGRPCCKCITSC